jgi:hypothetical protein
MEHQIRIPASALKSFISSWKRGKHTPLITVNQLKMSATQAISIIGKTLDPLQLLTITYQHIDQTFNEPETVNWISVRT